MVILANLELAQFRRYLGNWFCEEETLAELCGVDSGYLASLMSAGAIPGPVYRVLENGHVWSALAAYMGEAAALSTVRPGQDWFTPAAAYWIRSAKLVGKDEPGEIARSIRARFGTDFERALTRLDPDLKPYAGQIDDADHAWNAWITGAYAVCMKSFSADLVVEKLTRRLRARQSIETGIPALSTAQKQTLLTDVSRLSEILTPFSPFERPGGTPGTVIDRALAELNMGTDNPFNTETGVPLREAC